MSIMAGDRPKTWQERYDAAAAGDWAVQAEKDKTYFGASVGQFLLRQLPALAALFLLGLFLQSWVWGAAMAAFALVAALAVRAWVRRHYGITTRRPPES